MGGNDPAIVLPDVNIDDVAAKVAMGAFFNSGQVCIASKRIYVHESIYTPFVAAVAAVAKSLKVGTSNEAGVMLGPIQNEMQYERVKSFFKDTKEKGYKFALGNAEVESSAGYFIQPTIIDNPPEDSMIVTEEPFGPIVPVQSYKSVSEVIARANNSTMGLGATVFGTDLVKAAEVADQIESGSVWINNFPQPDPRGQFGGFKESGIGTEFGKLGILAYANIKSTHTFK
jgi:acyl-CoA reductase-like NAD-dependent aldehyde dehydrogenase